MDTITKIIAGPAAVLTTVFCIAGLLSIGLGLYWLFNKQARLRDLAELRKKLDKLAPSDPEYGPVRALYTSMVIDAERWGFFFIPAPGRTAIVGAPTTAAVIMLAMGVLAGVIIDDLFHGGRSRSAELASWPRSTIPQQRSSFGLGLRMSLNFVLVPGPLVRASSWELTAQELRKLGHHVQIPDVLDNQQPPPAWHEWTSHLLQRIASCQDPILVGHSSASALVADLARRLPCGGVIIVDGDVPPQQDSASPVRPALRDFIGSIAASDGTLPIWSRWFANDPRRTSLIGLDLLATDRIAFAEFERGLPRLSVDWFDDAIELAGWDHVPAGFIQCSPIYDHATLEARRRGWPVIRLEGTHLHPTLQPAETMLAILSMSRQLIRALPLSRQGGIGGQAG
jgi:hypothetical protein